MMIKGIIAEVKTDKAVLLTEDGSFITIKNKSYTIGQKITYSRPLYNKYMALAASIVLVIILTAAGAGLYYTPVSYLDIDAEQGHDSFLFPIPLYVKSLRAFLGGEEHLQSTPKEAV